MFLLKRETEGAWLFRFFNVESVIRLFRRAIKIKIPAVRHLVIARGLLSF